MTPLPELLAAYLPTTESQRTELQRFTDLLDAAGDAAFGRDHFVPGHITASCWIVDPGGDSCLLTHHRKLNRWLQLGGHCDGDPDVAAAALREAEEESGLGGFEFIQSGIYDLDIHEIPARKSDPAHLHYDVRFALRSTTGKDFTVSDESNDLAWVAIADLEDYTTEESVLRLARNWRDWQAIQAAT
ncbi:MAG: NUDIX hydrolase [Verrucomicrobiae bacterium]|nr:NUDIX hydrolase [Verrucomicrobiae bacterium]